MNMGFSFGRLGFLTGNKGLSELKIESNTIQVLKREITAIFETPVGFLTDTTVLIPLSLSCTLQTPKFYIQVHSIHH